MRKSEIQKGKFFTDNKNGLREVLDVGPQYKRYDSVEDDDCLLYRVHCARIAADVGSENPSTRVSFAAWAKEEVPADEVQAFIQHQRAMQIASKLSETQRLFLETFDRDLDEGSSIECTREEFRVAKACREKGLINDMPDKLTSECRHFDVKLSQLGISVIEAVHTR